MFKTRAEFEGKIYKHDTCTSIVSPQSKKFVDDCLKRRTEPEGDVGSVETKQAGHAVRTGGRETHTAFRLGTVKERDNLEDIDVDGRIMLIEWEQVRWFTHA
jgi:hypothetical protein